MKNRYQALPIAVLASGLCLTFFLCGCKNDPAIKSDPASAKKSSDLVPQSGPGRGPQSGPTNSPPPGISPTPNPHSPVTLTDAMIDAVPILGSYNEDEKAWRQGLQAKLREIQQDKTKVNDLISFLNGFEVPALALAAYFCRDDSSAQIAQALIDMGANIELEGSSPATPLGMATEATNLKVLEILLDNGADVNRGGKKNDGTIVPAWIIAACKGEAEALAMFKILFKSPVNVKKADSFSGGMLNKIHEYLHQAKNLSKKQALAQELINKGVDVNKLNEYNTTPWECAFSSEEFEYAKMLVKGMTIAQARANIGDTLSPIERAKQWKDWDRFNEVVAAFKAIGISEAELGVGGEHQSFDEEEHTANYGQFGQPWGEDIPYA